MSPPSPPGGAHGAPPPPSDAHDAPPALGLALQGADESLDRLSRRLWILQKRRGHRATTDDVLLAAFALVAGPPPDLLDLGSGKGTVALLLCGVLPALRALGIEKQPASVDLAQRNARLNGLEDRYTPLLADLRALPTLTAVAPRSMRRVLGAPPFMPLGTGHLPRDPLRAAGRFELHGGVEAYAQAAAWALHPEGEAVLLMDGHGRARLEAALAAAQLHLRALIAVSPRPERPPTYWIARAGHRAEGPAVSAQLHLRETHGEAWSAPYRALRAQLDLP